MESMTTQRRGVVPGGGVSAALSDAAGAVLGYSAPIWQWFNAAPRAGRFASGTAGVYLGAARTPAASSVLQLQLRFEHARVVDARFRAYGCPASIAVGAWLADWAIGRDAAALSLLSAAELRAALAIPDDRAHCALLGEDALRAAVAAFEKEDPQP